MSGDEKEAGVSASYPALVRLGFTGTRYGMTPAQMAKVDDIVSFEVTEVHHGDCVGADHDIHRIAKTSGIPTVVHPPSDQRLRAFTDGDTVLDPKEYLARNRDIVDSTDMLLATPMETSPQPKGGTWYTIRYARSQGKRVVIVWPSGKAEALASDEAKS